jgi:ABC-type nitrate/sulfonate/bicarbonate transport system ATPase subunit
MLRFFLMISFTYRCPRTGQEVYGHVAAELINGETYELVTCTACGDTHLINLKAGRLLEEAKKVEWERRQLGDVRRDPPRVIAHWRFTPTR